MFPSEWMDGLWATKSKRVVLIVRAISFQDSDPCDHNTDVSHVTDRRTERRTTCDHKTALGIVVHRAVKIKVAYCTL